MVFGPPSLHIHHFIVTHHFQIEELDLLLPNLVAHDLQSDLRFSLLVVRLLVMVMPRFHQSIPVAIAIFRPFLAGFVVLQAFVVVALLVY